MKRIVFVAWGGKGRYRHIVRSLLVASQLRRQAEIHFLTRCEGRTVCMIMDKGFPFSFSANSVPEADLVYIDCEECQTEELPEGERLFFTDSAAKGTDPTIATLPLEADGPMEGAKLQVLSPRFRHFHLFFHRRKFKKKGKHVLLALSSNEEEEFLEMLVYTLLEAGFSLRLVPHFELSHYYLKKLRKTFPKLQIVGRVNDLAREFFKCDLAVISGKLKPFEAAATGSPVLFLNDDEITRNFQRLGYGKIVEKDPFAVVDEVRDLSLDKERREREAKRGLELVDGLGLYRVVNIIRERLGL